MPDRLKHFAPTELTGQLRQWAAALGFSRLGISGIDLKQAGGQLQHWLERGYHGDMAFMAEHGSKRFCPDQLLPGTVRVISVAMDYLPSQAADPWQVLESGELGYVSRYALGRDYHKLMRKRLQQLADQIGQHIHPHGYRVFVDSAPVMEKPTAAQAGIGWQGKHSNVLNREGSWFFLGEIFTDLPLPPSPSASSHCGSCNACIDICPTRAIVAPYQVDARRCISYLTIEHHGSIPEALRPAIGNRIYGCDDCQLVCPWNRFARHTGVEDFQPRHQLDRAGLLQLLAWDEQQFLQRMEGSPIRRIGHTRWLRNIAVALGNAPYDEKIPAALAEYENHPSELVREHVHWAQTQQRTKR